jgi:SAM-dependent methyltransferase
MGSGLEVADDHAVEAAPQVLELGAGNMPTPEMIHHDRVAHAPWIDVAHDLELLPWPWDAEAWDDVWAFDVFEHLHLEVAEWLGECWRILVPGGVLHLRLPAWDNHFSYRDPTHQRVFHPETFDYFDPDRALWSSFGCYYFADQPRWWRVKGTWRQDGDQRGDLRFDLEKRP